MKYFILGLVTFVSFSVFAVEPEPTKAFEREKIILLSSLSILNPLNIFKIDEKNKAGDCVLNKVKVDKRYARESTEKGSVKDVYKNYYGAVKRLNKNLGDEVVYNPSHDDDIGSCYFNVTIFNFNALRFHDWPKLYGLYSSLCSMKVKAKYDIGKSYSRLGNENAEGVNNSESVVPKENVENSGGEKTEYRMLFYKKENVVFITLIEKDLDSNKYVSADNSESIERAQFVLDVISENIE